MNTPPDAEELESERQRVLEQHDDPGASPARIIDDRIRREVERALVWVSVIGLVALAVYIARPLLVIFGALVFAAMIDGGARLLGKVLPVARSIRVTLVCLAATAFFCWLIVFAGTRISQEAAQLPQVVEKQTGNLLAWAQAQGFEVNPRQLETIGGQIMSGVGTVTRAVGGAIWALTTMLLIAIIAVYIAFEPRLYERGVAWMFPRSRRADLYLTLERMAFTMRRLMAGRLLGMAVEGVFTYILLAWYGVPLAILLAILTGLLAFIPNVGAIVSGLLMVLVGFSGGWEMGLFTVFVYFLVQTIDGYLIVPLIARKTVDLAPALVLGAQFILGILFGILGLFLADPLVAMLKVLLERRAEGVETARQAGTGANPVSGGAEPVTTEPVFR